MTYRFISLKQHGVLFEMNLIQMRFEQLEIVGRQSAQQVIVHCSLPETGGSAKNSQLSVPLADTRLLLDCKIPTGHSERLFRYVMYLTSVSADFPEICNVRIVVPS